MGNHHGDGDARKEVAEQEGREGGHGVANGGRGSGQKAEREMVPLHIRVIAVQQRQLGHTHRRDANIKERKA